MSITRSSLLPSLLTGLLSLPQVAWAQNLSINGVTIDTGTGETLGTLSSHGGMDDFTKLQKEMVLSVLKQLGIDIQTLPPHIRGQIEKPQTTSAQALGAFARGLDLADKGQFAEAASAFKEAAKDDPGFTLASGMARLMPSFNLGGESGAGANALGEMRQNTRGEGQEQANQQLGRMNQPGDNMDNLGLSEGGGTGNAAPSMDPMNLVTSLEEPDISPQNFDDSGARQFTINEIKNIEDVQRDTVDEQTQTPTTGVAGDYQGFAAGYHAYNPDGYFYSPIASGSSSSVQIHFRPDESQVDASIHIPGDMLSGSSSPNVSFNIVSTCSNYTQTCGNVESPYSYYASPDVFWAYQHNPSTSTYDELVSGYYFYDTNSFSYSSWGYWWSEGDANDPYNTYTEGFWVAGDLTPAANIPNSGSATYTGGMVGYTQDGAYLEGSMNWIVNFANRNVSGSFDNITKNGSSWLTTTSVSGGWSAGTNAVSATITGTDVSSGIAKGAFFGPNAEELGGSWRINHINGDKGAGIFLGKPGGVPFQSNYGNY